MDTYVASDVVNKIPSLIRSRSSFEIVGASGKILDICSHLEREIESQELRCRIYTKNRTALAVGSLPIPVVAVSSLLGIASHNLLTYDPDYEIEKSLVDNRISVVFKK